MIILFKSNTKSLVITQATKILQGESAVDKIVFYIPEKYEDIELADYVITFNYISLTNTAMMEFLTKEDSDKEGYLKYTFDVESKITKLAGTITGYLSMLHSNPKTDKKHVIKSSPVSFDINALEDYYRFVSDESLSALDNKMLQIDNALQELIALEEIAAENKVDDLMIDENNVLHVSAEGNPLGTGVEVVVPEP